jgi:hypothetical protein
MMPSGAGNRAAAGLTVAVGALLLGGLTAAPARADDAVLLAAGDIGKCTDASERGPHLTAKLLATGPRRPSSPLVTWHTAEGRPRSSPTATAPPGADSSIALGPCPATFIASTSVAGTSSRSTPTLTSRVTRRRLAGSGPTWPTTPLAASSPSSTTRGSAPGRTATIRECTRSFKFSMMHA